MTIIVYRDGIMAADTWVTAGECVVGDASKIIKTSNGLWGASGHLADMGKFHLWADCDNPDPDIFEKMGFEDFFGIHVDNDGAIFYFDQLSKGIPTHILADFAVVGSAQDIAFGALEMGASAVEAVKATARRVPSIGGWVESLQLGGAEIPQRERLAK